MATASSEELCVVKIGGSLLTDLERPGRCDSNYLRAAAGAVGAIDRPTVLVHGTGGFGKPPAERMGFSDGFLGPDRADAFAAMEHRLDALRDRVLDALAEEDVPATGCRPASHFTTDEGTVVESAMRPLRVLLDRSVTPVLSGGFVPDRSRGFAVCSSDLQAAHAARALRADLLVYATNAPGVEDRSEPRPSVLDTVRLSEERIRQVTTRAEADVSGGMRGKLRAASVAARADVDAYVVDGREPERIRRLAAGRSIGATRLIPD